MILLLFLIPMASTISNPATWGTNPNIDAGQVKFVNEGIGQNAPANTNLTYTQHFNRTDFPSIPRVILGLISFGQLPPSNTSSDLIGFQATITTITNIDFNMIGSVQNNFIYMLHYLYFAVVNEDNNFYMQHYTTTFSSSNNLANITVSQRWELQYYQNPQNMSILNVNTSNVYFLAYITGFGMVAPDRIFLSINASYFNESYFEVNISTLTTTQVQYIHFSILAFNKETNQATYTTVIDIGHGSVSGNVSTIIQTSITNQTQQYKFRNSLSGVHHFDFPGGENNWFFYAFSSTDDNQMIWYTFNLRVRNCDNSTPYYQPNDELCYDNCPGILTENTTYNFCQQSVVCGDGIIATGQTCDDNNADSSDGCSNTCQIETDHTCFINSSLSNFSICYYSGSISLYTKLIYKYPFENKVRLEFKIYASNANEGFLNTYLSTLSVVLTSTSRMLQTQQSIDQKSVSYDSNTNILTIQFTYTQTIDLTKKKITIVSSQSTSTNSQKYFFDTPSTQIQLGTTYNLLPTTYYSDQQLQSFKNISYGFLTIVILYCIFFAISIVIRQSAKAVECMLVLIIFYICFVGQQTVYEGWAGILQYGKYTVGYNFEITDQDHIDKLKVLNLDGNLLNAINLSFFISCGLLVAIIIIQIHRCCTTNSTQQALSEQKYQSNSTNSFKTKVIVKPPLLITYLYEFSLAFNFLIIIFVSSVIAFSSSEMITKNIPYGFAAIGTGAITWIFFFWDGSHGRFVFSVSFWKILHQKKIQQGDSFCCKKVYNSYNNFVYAFIHVYVLFAGIILSLSSDQGNIAFIGILIALIIQAVIIWKFQIYHLKMCRVHSYISLILLSILVIFHLIQFYANLSSKALPIIAIIVLALNLAISIFIVIKIKQKQISEDQKDNSLNDSILKVVDGQFNIIEDINCRREEMTKRKIMKFRDDLEYESIKKNEIFNEQQAKQKIAELKTFKKQLNIGNGNDEDGMKIYELNATTNKIDISML